MSSCPNYRAWATPLRLDSLRRLKSARRIGGSGSSSWPTATAQDDNKSPEAHLAMKWRMGERDGTHANRTAITSLQVAVKQWTKGRPLGRQAPRSGIGGPPSSPGGPTSPRLWKTPHGAGNIDKTGKMGGGGEFHKEVVNWQTPRTGAHGIPGADATHGGQPKGMRLNPRFVCWLMNFPLGWTSFESLESTSYERWAMQLFQLRLSARGNS